MPHQHIIVCHRWRSISRNVHHDLLMDGFRLNSNNLRSQVYRNRKRIIPETVETIKSYIHARKTNISLNLQTTELRMHDQS